MKVFLSIATALFTLVACQSEDTKPDAYGHFESEDYIISSEAMGKWTLLKINEGNNIMKGDIIGYVDTSQVYLQKKKVMTSIEAIKKKTNPVESEIAVLNTKISNLDSEISRFEKLVRDSAAAPKMLDDLKAQKSLTNKQIDAVRTKLYSINAGILAETEPLKAQLDILNNLIERSVVKSPLNGKVKTVYLKSGEMAVPGKPLLKVTDNEEFFMRGYLSGEQLSEVVPGQTVTIKYDGPEGISDIKAIVAWVSEEAEFTPKSIQTRNERVNLVYATKIRVKNNGTLKSGMPAELWINNKEK